MAYRPSALTGSQIFSSQIPQYVFCLQVREVFEKSMLLMKTEKFHLLSIDDRRIKKYFYLNENVMVLTGTLCMIMYDLACVEEKNKRNGCQLLRSSCLFYFKGKVRRNGHHVLKRLKAGLITELYDKPFSSIFHQNHPFEHFFSSI